jgi:hypothetical protein
MRRPETKIEIEVKIVCNISDQQTMSVETSA